MVQARRARHGSLLLDRKTLTMRNFNLEVTNLGNE